MFQGLNSLRNVATINKAVLVKCYDSSAMITMNNAESQLNGCVNCTYLHFQRLLSSLAYVRVGKTLSHH